MNINNRKVLALLMMPPPVHGASTINKKMVDYLSGRGFEVDILNTVPSRFSNYFNGARWKVLRAFHIVAMFFKILSRFSDRPGFVYIGISGGAGLLFDCVLGLAVAVLKVPVYVHHHSFAYLNKKSFLFMIFCRILSREKVTHLVLCEEMKERINTVYSCCIDKNDVFSLSNAAFFDSNSLCVDKKINSSILQIGYISNITREKGVLDVIDLFDKCVARGINFRLIIAGPCSDPAIRKKLEEYSVNHDFFHYLGPVYGEEKKRFYESLDVLVFPTRYENEAEPLVIYEAAEQGVVTIANARGCIASMVECCGGWAVNEPSRFINEAIDIVLRLQSVELRRETRINAIRGYAELLRNSANRLNMIF